MCTSPIQLEKKFADGSSKVYTVPCGKCPECRAKYQSEYAALSVLEANEAGSLAFITLTYNDDSLPLLDSVVRCTEVVDPCTGEVSLVKSISSDGLTRCSAVLAGEKVCRPIVLRRDVLDDGFVDYVSCPSLHRDDVKSFLKKYRQDYFRRYGERLDLRMSCFGEYGERYHRPHYHMIVYGLSRDEVNRLVSKWSYGFTNVQFVDRFNSDGSDAFVKVSRYVSKYISKCEFLPDFVRDGFAEKPRKQSSVRLGRRNLNYEHMRNFI